MSASPAAEIQKRVSAPECLVGGRWVMPEGERQPVFNPATGEELCSLSHAGPELVSEAVQAAHAALPKWSAMAPTQRSRLLLELGRLLVENTDTLAPLITLDNGKPLADARGEIQRALDHLEAAATAPALLTGYGAQDVVGDWDVSVMRIPVGVCAVISPFNFPIMTGLIYHAWALACGNTVVLKPSEQAPLAAGAFGRLFAEAGFPDGVFNVVHGGRDTVTALIEHPLVSAISLVGSTATARAVYAAGATHGKRVHTAGGARNFIVVMPDADLDAAAHAVSTSIFAMAGQRCLSSSVLVAVGDAYDEVVDAVVAQARSLVVGSGFDEKTDVPPLVSRAAVEHAHAMVESALAEGATLLLDGRDADAGDGYFFGPTVVADVGADSSLITTETFAPLLAVLRANDLDEAIALCNGSPFGNAACIFTSLGHNAKRFSRDVDAGNIGVNVGVAAPPGQFGFGGRRNSFFGTVHSQGREAVEFFTDRKSLTARWP